MTNNTRIAFYACLLLLAIIVGACVKDSTVPEGIHKQPQDFCLADARKHYEENIENLCFPEIYLKPIIQTKGSSYFHNLEQTPLWDRFHFSENGWSYIYEIPILYNIPLNASIGFITREGRMIKQDKEVRLQTNLIIQKYKESGNVHIFLSTIIGYIPNSDKEIQGGSPWLWTGDRRNFIGYQFFTNADGSFKGAFQYRNSHRTSITLSIYDKDREYTYPQEAFILNLGSVGTKSVGTRSQDQYCWECRMPMSDEDTYCPSCGAGPETLPPAIVIEKATCEQCDLLLSNCICGNGGGNNGDDGDRCPDCLSSECFGECQEIGGGGGTTPGGSEPTDTTTYYTITAISNTSSGGGTEGGGTFPANTTITLTATKSAGYDFCGWKNEGSLYCDVSLSVLVDASKTYKAYFYPENSECAKLFRNYKNNGNLFGTVNEHSKLLNINSKIEHAVLRRNNGTYKSVSGDENSVHVKLSPNDVYEHIIHNHPSKGLVPSPEDIYLIFKADSALLLATNASFLIQSKYGTLSIEIDDREVFEAFAVTCLVGDKERKVFRRYFNENVLGNPNEDALLTEDIRNKAVKFYITNAGLKFAYTKSNGHSTDWSYLKIENSTITEKDCLN